MNTNAEEEAVLPQRRPSGGHTLGHDAKEEVGSNQEAAGFSSGLFQGKTL